MCLYTGWFAENTIENKIELNLLRVLNNFLSNLVSRLQGKFPGVFPDQSNFSSKESPPGKFPHIFYTNKNNFLRNWKFCFWKIAKFDFSLPNLIGHSFL